MSYPVIIVFELSTFDEEGFPVAVAWSLPGGKIKHSLISPEDEWLERDHGYLEVDPRQLMLEGHSAKAILSELRDDMEDETLYCIDPPATEQALSAIEEALDMELDLPLRPLAELFADVPADERELVRRECESLLGLDDHSATGQVRLWLEMVHRCGLSN